MIFFHDHSVFEKINIDNLNDIFIYYDIHNMENESFIKCCILETRHAKLSIIMEQVYCIPLRVGIWASVSYIETRKHLKVTSHQLARQHQLCLPPSISCHCSASSVFTAPAAHIHTETFLHPPFDTVSE